MKNYTLITGASSGLGYEFCKLFAKDGNNLVLVARRKELLDKYASELSAKYGISVRVIAKDLSLEKSPDEIFNTLRTENIKLSALINNAGFGYKGSFEEIRLDIDMDMIKVNMLCLVKMTKLFLNDIIESNDGGILNVASTAAFQPGPFMAVYFATKAFVLSFSESLAEELSKTDVIVSTLCPGPTKTEFQGRANMNEAVLFESKLIPVMSAESVAKKGYEGFIKKKRVVIPGIFNEIGVNISKITPTKLTTKIIGLLNKNIT